MNKYARIDKKVTKGQIYLVLWLYHDMTISHIARNFGISERSVCRGIQRSWSWTSHNGSNSLDMKRAHQLAWSYTF